MNAHALPGRTARWTAAAVLCLVAACGCSAGTPDHASAHGAPAAATPGTTVPGSADASATAGSTDSSTGGTGADGSSPRFSRDPVAATSTRKAQLTSISASTSGGVDRLVFTFAGTAPGYRVEPVARVTTGADNDPAADVVEIAGAGFLSVGFSSTTPNVHGAISAHVPTNTDLHLPLLRQIVLVHNVAGDLRFGVGLNAASPSFRVLTSQNPARVIVEIQQR